MNYYLSDTFVNDKKYDRVIDKIKERLLELDITGKMIKMSILKRVDDLIEEEAKRGAKTITIIGNDQSFLKVVDPIARNNVALGFIPVGEPNNIAKLLGIPKNEDACEVLAARKIVETDIGEVNGLYFFSNVKMEKNPHRLVIEQAGFKMMPTRDCKEVCIYNFYYPQNKEAPVRALDQIDAQDGKLNLVIREQGKSGKGILKIISSSKKDGEIDTFLVKDRFMIKSFEYLPLMLDGYRLIKTPAKIKIAKAKLKLIVSKNRGKLLR